MAWAASLVGVGPMAAVAGAMAQWAAKAALAAGAEEAIVDNGGDIYLKAVEPVIVSLGTGTSKLADRLAFRVEPEETPISICSSSGKMGHSMSLGQCDLATIVAKDAALADAAATQAANLVRTPDGRGRGPGADHGDSGHRRRADRQRRPHRPGRPPAPPGQNSRMSVASKGT